MNPPRFLIKFQAGGGVLIVSCSKYFLSLLSPQSLSNNLYFSDSHHVGWYFCASKGIHFPSPLVVVDFLRVERGGA